MYSNYVLQYMQERVNHSCAPGTCTVPMGTNSSLVHVFPRVHCMFFLPCVTRMLFILIGTELLSTEKERRGYALSPQCSGNECSISVKLYRTTIETQE